MTEAQKDTERAKAAVKAIIDARDTSRDFGGILVTTEHTVAVLLLALIGSPSSAAQMLNEGLVQGIESRLALYCAKTGVQ